MPKATHHELHTGQSANWMQGLRASVLGANDGVISMAALLVGIAGAAASSHTLLIAGIAGIAAGAFSMAVGEYVSVSSQRDTERAMLEKERYELEHFKESEFAELVAIYEGKGLTHATAEKVAEELTHHDVLTAHAEAELGINPKDLTNPWVAGIASAISYTLGGIIPTVAIVLPTEENRIVVAFIAVLISLIITGLLAARVTGAKPVPTVLRVVVGGMLAMVVTYGIGKLFHVSV